MSFDSALPASADRAAANTRAPATRARLLDAASRLFSERGYSGTSMRAVTQAAGLSVSAANYHFGSKRALLHAVCDRTIAPVNRARMSALARVDAAAAPAAPLLEDVLHAFFAPAILLPVDRRPGAREVAARLYADPPEIVAELKRELFGPISERMTWLLGRAFPDASPRDVALAFQLTVGVMVHVVGGHLDWPATSDAASQRDERLVESLVAYSAAGIRGQLAASGESA